MISRFESAGQNLVNTIKTESFFLSIILFQQYLQIFATEIFKTYDFN